MDDKELENGLKSICKCSPQDTNFWYIEDPGYIFCRGCGQIYGSDTKNVFKGPKKAK